MTEPPADLAGLLCARLCHDLTSPIGALANGLELLGDENDPEMRRRCFALLEQSARAATDKLRFFRMAFGATGVGNEPVRAHEARALVAGIAGPAQRIALDWTVTAEAMPLDAARTLLLLAMIGGQALARGGALTVGAETQGRGWEVVVRAAAERLAFDAEAGRALQGELPQAALTSRLAPAALAHTLVAGRGGRIEWMRTDDALLLGAQLPA